MARSFVPELTNAEPVPETRLQGRKLVIARIIWATLVVFTLGLFTAMLPTYFAKLQTKCIASVCALGQPSLETVRALQAHGLTVVSYAVFAIALNIFVTVICVVVALLIIRRRSDDWIALLVALTLVLEGTTFITYVLLQNRSAWQLPAFILDTFSWSVIFLLFYLFPDGRFVPRWTLWLVIAWIGCSTATTIFPFFFLSHLLENLVWLFLCASSMVSQIYRYRRVSGPVQRQQTKWIVYGASMAITVVIALDIPILFLPSFGPGSLYSLISWYSFILALIPFPLSISFAVQRSRLWDIDNIINRTLVYTLLTALLALVYFGNVTLLQYLFRSFTGQGSPVAIIGSTLAIALLFHPLRRYLQTTIDTGFYRRIYDASEVLARFDGMVRSCLYSCAEESQETLTGNVREIVNEALQPSNISLWLYALELPKESGEIAQEARHNSQVTSTLVWEDQEETPQEHYLRVSEKNTQGKKLHNRPWKIDAFVNHTLSYGALVGVIALASIGILVIQQQLAQALPAQISEFFIVGSVLAMVMCFKLLRRHIQSFINRRFYPHKFQAEQTLDGFAATLRHEVNLTRLSEGLLESVNEAMEPEYVSLWINKPEPESEVPRYTGVLQR